MFNISLRSSRNACEFLVTSIVPDGKPATGYEIANKAIIDGLKRAGVKVTVIGFVWPGSTPLDPGKYNIARRGGC